MADKLISLTQLQRFQEHLESEVAETYVVKETGKGLSTNDYSNTDKAKLDGIEEGANKTIVDDALNDTSVNPVQNKVVKARIDEIVNQGGEPNKIDSIKVNGVAQTIAPDKSVDINMPTKLSQLQNDTEFQTQEEIETLVNSKLSSVYTYKGTVESYGELPTEGQKIGDTYNVETADEGHGIKAGDNVSWNGEAWDVLSGTIDLSNYYDLTNYPLATNNDIDALFA